MPSPDQTLRAELAQTQVQLHQVMTAVQRQIHAFDTALRSIENVIGQLAETDALPADVADRQRAELVGVRNNIANTGTYLHWRLRSEPKG